MPKHTNQETSSLKQHHKYIGLDVHKDQNQVAIVDDRPDGEVRLYGSISNDLHALEKLTRKLGSENVVLHFVQEDGPCGFVIARRLAQLKIGCMVVAPSLVPKKASDRVKTNRRDARMLARLRRAGELKPIRVPDASDEAIRDLCRVRTDAVKELRATRFRLKAFLLRHGDKDSGKSSWTPVHMCYLRELMLSNPAQKVVPEEDLLAITQAGERIETALESLARAWRWWPVVEALQSLRGVWWLTGRVLVAEVGDFHRFAQPRQLTAQLGLVPSEYSTGDSQWQGSITKCGNSQARWFVVEAAQSYRLASRVSAGLSKRQEPVSARVCEISWKAPVRLHERFVRLVRRGKRMQKIQVAIARELVGFLWAVAREVPAPQP